MSDSEKLERFMKEAKEEAWAAVSLADTLLGKDDILGRDLREKARSVMYAVNETNQDILATNADLRHPAMIDDMKRVKKHIGELRDLVEYHKDPDAFKKRVRERQERETPPRHHSIRYWLRVFHIPKVELKQKLSSMPVNQNIEEEIASLESEQGRLVKWFTEYLGNDDDYLKTAAWKLQLILAKLKRFRGMMAGARARERWNALSDEERQERIETLQAAKRAKSSKRTLDIRKSLNEDKLRARHDARSKRARTRDEKSNAKLIINPAKFNAPVELWYNNPGACDLLNIDTKKLTREQKAARDKALLQKMSSGPQKRKRRTDPNRHMNMGLQHSTMVAMAGRRGINISERDVVTESDPSLSLEENWQNFEDQAKWALYESPEWHILESSSPRRRKQLLLSRSRKNLYAVAKKFGGTSKMPKDKLVKIILKNKAWRG